MELAKAKATEVPTSTGTWVSASRSGNWPGSGRSDAIVVVQERS